RTAACSGVSPSSMRPAGNSTQTASTGGPYCRITIVEGGLLGWRRIGAIATASTPLEPRVFRAAASQILFLPVYDRIEYDKFRGLGRRHTWSTHCDIVH